MLVRAIKGGKYPIQGKPGQFITDGRPVEVPVNSYYRRAIAKGSLEQATPVEINLTLDSKKKPGRRENKCRK